ncbi:hypothetical protein M758_11G153400 [Ceratodon purpureus]|uniref:Uncharacterized protein n=1 Tax=Ceratodon purpureus TaxID=3225 RepID=A0A8T0GEF2_CERPU|nr:hypothetical protein KC19_11G157400 [Ceratodon purpureus]KAG0601997.1 hypothetical protein M758_11G153400 [Ceratodon purpureus]
MILIVSHGLETPQPAKPGQHKETKMLGRSVGSPHLPFEENSQHSLGQGLRPWRPHALKCSLNSKLNSASPGHSGPQTSLLDTIHGNPDAHCACSLRRARGRLDKLAIPCLLCSVSSLMRVMFSPPRVPLLNMLSATFISPNISHFGRCPSE